MTTVATPDPDVPRTQLNTGSGTFIGRDSYKIEMLDANTKAVLEKLSKDFPTLGRLLSEALRDGVISRDAIYALENAARSINEDVAHSLWTASQNIDHDVAKLLFQAGQNINGDVAGQIGRASSDLEATTRELERTIGILKSTKANVGEWQRVAETMDSAAQNRAYAAQQESSDEWSWYSFKWGAGLCFAAVLIVLVLWTSIIHK